VRSAKFPVLALMIAAMLTLPPASGQAQGFVDLYMGAAFTRDADVTVTTPTSSVTEREDFRNFGTFGARLGCWFKDAQWFGIAGDFSIFFTDFEGVRYLETVPLSALLMFRAQLLQSTAFPNGRLQPYVGMGPGLFITRIEYCCATSGYSIPGSSGLYVDYAMDMGLDLRAGLSWGLTKRVALFGEYRFTAVEHEFVDDVMGVSQTIETELRTHHALFGLSYRY
jgi:opacity protein-like surface antigen